MYCRNALGRVDFGHKNSIADPTTGQELLWQVDNDEVAV